MKEIGFSRRFRFISRVVIPTVVISSLIGFLISLLTLYKYPWLTVTADFNHSPSWWFTEPWPQNPLIQELHEKKKKRYPRTELERIFQLDLRRMEFINIPVLDVLHGGQANLSGIDEYSRSLGFSEYPWPWFETTRNLSEKDNLQKVSYVLLPTARGLTLTEGVLINPGEEFEFTLPLAKLRRNFRFYILPQNTGTLRISIGQYSWTRSFFDMDINQLQLINIPINDTVSTQLKILPSSVRIFLLLPKITQAEMSGRIPIQVAEQSSIWKVNPELFKNDVQNENNEEQEDNPNEILPNFAQLTPETKPPLQDIPFPLKPTPTPTLPPAGSLGKNEQLDSMNVVGNSQIFSSTSTTAAVGYNVLFFHINDIPPDVLANKTLMKALAPHLSTLLDDALVLENSVELNPDPIQDFRSVIIGDKQANYEIDDPILMKNAFARTDSFNLYSYVRDFGYHVLSIAPAKVFGVNENLTDLKGSGIIGTKSFDSNDWSFARKRLKIDRDAQPLRGLEAVIGKEQVLAQPLVTSDYVAIREYLEQAAKSVTAFPDWKANEIYVPNSKSLYMASVIDYLQNWTSVNKQQRFFFHVWLNSLADSNLRPSIKDFFHVIRRLRLVGLWKELANGELSKVAMIDRGLEQILDVLKVRLLIPRTVIVFVFDHKKNSQDANKKGSAAIFLPGVKVKAFNPQTETQVKLVDILATSLSLVGVPLTTHNEENNFLAEGRNLESVPAKPQEVVNNAPIEKIEDTLKPPQPEPTPQNKKLFRYVLHIKPEETGCDKIIWQAAYPIFGMKFTHPVIEMEKDNMKINIFPCAIKAPLVSIFWYQQADELADNSSHLNNAFGGSFVTEGLVYKDENYPSMFFGKHIYDFGHLIFSYKGLSVNPINSALNFPIKDNGEFNAESILSLAYLAKNSNYTKNYKVDLKKTSALFYRQPVEAPSKN